MVPFFGWALLHDGGDAATWRWVAFGLFAVAMITDKIDGDLARKHNLITDFGKIADPIADKAITGWPSSASRSSATSGGGSRSSCCSASGA